MLLFDEDPLQAVATGQLDFPPDQMLLLKPGRCP